MDNPKILTKSETAQV